MKDVIKHNGHTLLMYTSIQDLPVDRFQMYNRAVLIDSGIGSDLSDFNSHISTIRKLIKTEPDKAIKLLNNMQQLVHFTIENTSPKMTAFVALIRAIDGEELTEADLTDEGTKRVVERLAEIKTTRQMVFNFLSDVKKKLISSLKFSFREKTRGED